MAPRPTKERIINMGINHLQIQICESVEEAPKYVSPWQSVIITKAIVVRNGTHAGNDTIDLQLTDDKGNQYVAMITARPIKQLANLTITDRH